MQKTSFEIGSSCGGDELMQPHNDPVPNTNESADPSASLPLHPVPVDRSRIIDPILGVAAMVLGGGMTLYLAVASQSRTAGATRSTKLQWEERQQAIDAAQYIDAAQQNANSATQQSD
jgi:hypothetical protein